MGNNTCHDNALRKTVAKSWSGDKTYTSTRSLISVNVWIVALADLRKDSSDGSTPVSGKTPLVMERLS